MAAKIRRETIGDAARFMVELRHCRENDEGKTIEDTILETFGPYTEHHAGKVLKRRWHLLKDGEYVTCRRATAEEEERAHVDNR
jgi:hypothetical protein